MYIPLCKPYVDKREVKEVEKVINSGWLSGGRTVKEFEKQFREWIGTKHAIAMNSCTSALHISILVCQIQGEILVPSFTFVATVNAIITAGCKPVFTDIEFYSNCIDPIEAEKLVRPETKAIIPVHFGGKCCDIGGILGMAKRKNLIIIEDVAQSFGAMLGGMRCGDFGTTGCFSFFPTKIMTTGEGGMLTTDNDTVAERARALINHGIKEKRTAIHSGFNLRMSDINAAVGIAQLKKMKEIMSLRRKWAHMLTDLLDEELFYLPHESDRAIHMYQMYTIKVKEGIERNYLLAKLLEAGIQASVHYDPPVHLMELYKEDIRGPMEVTERVAKIILTLPMYPGLKKKEVEYIAEKTNQIAKELKK